MADIKCNDKTYYNERGESRRMLIMDTAYFDQLKDLASEFTLTQGEIVEVLMANMEANMETFRSLFEAKRQQRVAAKQARTELARKMKNLDPAKLREVERLLGGN